MDERATEARSLCLAKSTFGTLAYLCHVVDVHDLSVHFFRFPACTNSGHRESRAG